MEPRILLRTHYQVHEPRIVIHLVTQCASAAVSRNEESLAQKLKSDVRGWDKGLGFGTPAATYAISYAQDLGLLNASNRQTPPGIALAYWSGKKCEPSEQPPLALLAEEKRLYLLQYLLSSGALVLHFCELIRDRETVALIEFNTTGLIEGLLVQTLNDYLEFAHDARTRSAIRLERDRLQRTKYDDKTRRHKVRPIVQTLRRLQLLESDEAEEHVRPDREGRLRALVDAIPSIEQLERLAGDRNSMRTLVSRIYADETSLKGASVGHQIADAYDFVMRLGLQTCSLQFLDDCIFSANRSYEWTKQRSGAAETILSGLHTKLPREVRFHVDRQGRRAFVLLSSEALRSLRSADQTQTLDRT